jgi:stage V sporulation protein S
MDRFFSKLDLRDIKIKPEGNRFLPTDDDAEVEESQVDARPSSTFVAESPIASAPLHARPSEAVVVEVEPLDAEPVYRNGADMHADVTNGSVDVIHDNGEVLKVSARSRPSAVAGAIAGVVRDAGRAEVQAIGAGATNQAVKAVAIARDYLLESGIDAVCVPAFIDVTIDNEERTAIRLVVETR